MSRKDLESSWEVEQPGAGFAGRVVTNALAGARDVASSRILAPLPRVNSMRPRRPLLRYVRVYHRSVALGLACLVALGGVLAWWGSESELVAGEATAVERTTLFIGEHARAVLEPHARLVWSNEQVTQPSGDVFFRVDQVRQSFRVATPAGDIEVLGTCFRVRVGLEHQEKTQMRTRDLLLGGGGAALAAVTVVTVYEGKARLVHANQSVVLEAGQSGRLDSNGARELNERELGKAELALSGSPGGAPKTPSDAPLKVPISGRTLEDVEREKRALEAQLRVLKNELAQHVPARERHAFDLDREDWKELAAEGRVKFRVPCLMPGGASWNGLPPAELDKLGLSPEDGQTLVDAYRRSNERIWATLRPLCVAAVGSEDAAEALGGVGCAQAVNKLARETDGKAAREAFQMVADVRAGLRPEPDRGQPRHPMLESMLALTGEMALFEADLAEAFGPEEAKRLAWGPGCMQILNLVQGPLEPTE